jgi:dienelactone hydrolase
MASTLVNRMKWLLVMTALLAAPAAWGQPEQTIMVETRGQKLRALLLQPEQPAGSVILLAGGHGNLRLSADGRIHWGANNQVVRTRANYARAGFVTLVPDMAPDLKRSDGGSVAGSRFGPENARDIGALVTYLRAIKPPVFLVATSRGAVSAGNAVARLDGPERPDGMVLTAPMLMTVEPSVPSVQMTAGNDPRRIALPLLVVGHEKDACRWTNAGVIAQFKQWYEASGARLDLVMLDGPAGSGDPCEPDSAHGFTGIDDRLVATVVDWLQAQMAAR